VALLERCVKMIFIKILDMLKVKQLIAEDRRFLKWANPAPTGFGSGISKSSVLCNPHQQPGPGKGSEKIIPQKPPNAVFFDLSGVMPLAATPSMP